MDATDYWLFAREYAIWNTAVTALQFWTADLKPHALSRTIERVYNSFFYISSAPQLWNQPKEILFGHFVTTLNHAFEQTLALEDKDMRVAVKISTFPLLSDKCPEFTMFPVMRTFPSILPLHIPQLHTSQATNLYAVTYHSAVLMRRAPQQSTAPCLHHLFSTP